MAGDVRLEGGEKVEEEVEVALVSTTVVEFDGGFEWLFLVERNQPETDQP